MTAMATTREVPMMSQAATARRGADLVQAQLAKTKLCTHFQQGRCPRDQCMFAHCLEELRAPPDFAKTRLCELNKQGLCALSPDTCKFAHSKAELRSCLYTPHQGKRRRQRGRKAPSSKHTGEEKIDLRPRLDSGTSTAAPDDEIPLVRDIFASADSDSTSPSSPVCAPKAMRADAPAFSIRDSSRKLSANAVPYVPLVAAIAAEVCAPVRHSISLTGLRPVPLTPPAVLHCAKSHFVWSPRWKGRGEQACTSPQFRVQHPATGAVVMLTVLLRAMPHSGGSRVEATLCADSAVRAKFKLAFGQQCKGNEGLWVETGAKVVLGKSLSVEALWTAPSKPRRVELDLLQWL